MDIGVESEDRTASAGPRTVRIDVPVAIPVRE